MLTSTDRTETSEDFESTKTLSAPAKAGMSPFYCTIHTFMTGILIVGK